jgi:peptide/nickel transport system substrate-binding protein
LRKLRFGTPLTALAASALVLTGCTPAATTRTASVDDSIKVAVSALPSSYDLESNFQASNENYTLWAQTMANLLGYVYEEKDGVQVQDFTKFKGVLAEEENPYTISDDGQTYTFHLRKDILSHAGNPLTAEDVRWSVERKFAVNGGVLSQLKSYFSSMDQVEVVDDHTIAFHLDHPGNNNIFLQVFTGQMGKIWDKTEMVKHATDADPWAAQWAKANPGAGFGPYEVESVTEGQQMVLTANPGSAVGESAIRTITLQVVPDSGTRAQLLASGDVDLAESLTPSDQVTIGSNPNVQLPEVENPIEFVALALVKNKAPFDDDLVRQAFSYAIPYEEIINQIYQGRATPSSGWITSTMGVTDISGEPAYTYDVEKAKKLLSEAGKPAVDVTLTVSNAIPDIVDAAIMIKSYAADAGFNVTVNQLAPAEFGTGRVNLSFQSILAANRSQTQTPSYISVNFFSPTTANNSGFVATEEWNGLVKSAVDAGPGTSKEAAPFWQKVQDYLNEDASHLPMVYKQPNQAYSAGLAGMSYRYDNTVDYSLLTPAGK